MGATYSDDQPANHPVLGPAARSVWGKSDRDSEDWLPLYRHMSDSGAVAVLLWDRWLPSGVRTLVAGGTTEDEHAVARRLVGWLATAHDLGKATPAFAMQVTPLADGMHRQGLTMTARRGDSVLVRHATASHLLLRRWLLDQVGMEGDIADTYAVVVGGHHGVPPSTLALEVATNRPELTGRGNWEAVQRELADYAASEAGVADDLRSRHHQSLDVRAQVLVTALVIMADWLASNRDLFPWVDRSSGADRAERALADIGLPPAWQSTIEPGADIHQLMRDRFELPDDTMARPVQQTVLELARTVDEPGLIIVEAPMGEGKTEAALLAAEVLAQRTGAGGCFIALPTMATSDAMFTRVLAWARHLPGNQQMSTFLAHGKAALNEDAADLRHAGRVRGVAQDDPDGPGAGSVVAVQWLASRKKGVLSNLVVGTIDQLLVGALKSRHLVLRHLALAGKVVVIDEAHAADQYMAQYLDRALEWLGAYRVPTVVLSATLPSDRRVAMVAAYETGRRTTSAANASPDGSGSALSFRRRGAVVSSATDPYSGLRGDIGYPVVTATTSSAPTRRICEPSGRATAVRVDRLADDDAALLGLLDQELVDGGCVGIVRNTVARAQHTARLLREHYGDDVLLVHSRFLAVDRAALERRVRDELGPNGRPRPSRRVLVGTQVLEQSLDIDLDLLVTDLPPTDLLLQRVGRLHRHSRGPEDRPPRLRAARCVVTGVEDWSTEPPTPIGDSDYIYGRAPLLRTLAVLARRGEAPVIRLPEDIAPMVQEAYAAEPAVPESWQVTVGEAEVSYRQELADRRLRADTFRLGPVPRRDATLIDWLAAGFGDADVDDSANGQKAVRDGEDTLEVVVAQRVGGELRLLPWIKPGVVVLPADAEPSWEVARTLATCTVRLPGRLTEPWLVDRVIAALEAVGSAAWQRSPWLRGQLVLVLDEDLTAELAGHRLTYSRQDGLVVERAGAESP